MAGRSLWSIFMVAWLSATNLPPSAGASPLPEVSLSEPAKGGDAVRLPGGIEDEAAVSPVAVSEKPEL
jgi:hypothetical protein